jgi:hypothetical protein
MTDFDKIEVDSANHGYRINGKTLLSVTTLIKHVAPEFDKDTVSQRMADRGGVSQAEILRQWEEKGAYSRDKGTRVHSYIEDRLNGKYDLILASTNERPPEIDGFDAAWKSLCGNLNAKPVCQELVVGDEQFGVAGRIDTLLEIVLPKLGRQHCVFDWKTGKLETKNSYERLLPPFQAYDNCKLNVYSIQLSLYRLILERNRPGEPYGECYILHLRPDGSYMLHRAVDFRSILAEWLKDGVPPDALSDPAAEKRATDIIKMFEELDPDFATKLSRRTHTRLAKIAKKVLGNAIE